MLWTLPIAASALIVGASILKRNGKVLGFLDRGWVWPLGGGLGVLGAAMYMQDQKQDEEPELIGLADPYDEDQYIDPEVGYRQKEFSNEFRINVLDPRLMGVVDPVRLREEGRMGQEPYFKWGGRKLLITRTWPEGAQIPSTDPSIHDIPGLPTVDVTGEVIDRRIWKG